MQYDILIIGSGPAGLTAGIYGARGGKRTAILTGSSLGGQAALTHRIENFSGHIGIDGWELTQTMLKQAETLGVEPIYDEATEFHLKETPKRIETANGVTLFAHSVILATGAKHKKLGVPREEELTGHGVSYCAACDGGFFRGKTVIVAGGGDTAFTDALYLKDIAAKVYLVHRRDTFRAATTLVQRLKNTENAEILTNFTVTALNGNPLTSVTLTDSSGTQKEIKADGIFIAVGAEPNTAPFACQIQTENGYVVTDANMRTSLTGVYAAGDLRNTPLRQIITACADGAVAAETAIRDLDDPTK